MCDNNWSRAQIALFLLAITIIPLSIFVAVASIETMQHIMDGTRMTGELPWFTAACSYITPIGFVALAAGSIVTLGILTFKYHNFVALAISWAILAFVIYLCLSTVLASQMPFWRIMYQLSK